VNPAHPFRDAELVKALANGIRALDINRPVRIMEVCGGHTEAIYRFALRDLLPDWIELTSGPGCPVCVTANDFIDRAVALARLPGMTIATFGDLVRVPGSSSSLAEVRSQGADVRVFYSAMDALCWARDHPGRLTVFLGIGFETTACTIAGCLVECRRLGLDNFRLLSTIKTMPRALRALLTSPDVNIDGLILPGHVTTVTGMEIFRFIAEELSVPCVVSGFEPVDIMQTLLMLCRQMTQSQVLVLNQYRRVAQREGNRTAQAMIERAFEPCDAEWRGLGLIPLSGLKLRDEFSRWDALSIPVEVEPTRNHPACRCGEVLRGVLKPVQCPLFAKACNPETPCGACMVSSEGACAAVYHFAAKTQ